MLLEDLQVILKVAEFRSITAAATSLDMRTATASAAVKRVEASLGVDLFVRTTRHLRLSNAGERYIPHCQQALQTLSIAKQSAKGDLDEVDGELRIALSSDLGRNIVLPWINEFMQSHKKVSLRANITDSNIDFYRDSVDLALRYGSPNDANVYGFKICNVPRILCATQNYLDTHGTPEHPHDLVSHQGLFYQLQDIIKDVWVFSHDSGEFKIKMKGKHASNDGDLVRRWCVDSHGIAVKSCLDMSADLLADRVVPVMQDFVPVATELWLIFPSRQSITPAARLLRDMLKDKCNDILKALVAKNIISRNVFD